jgi:hypothetical protein
VTVTGAGGAFPGEPHAATARSPEAARARQNRRRNCGVTDLLLCFAAVRVMKKASCEITPGL